MEAGYRPSLLLLGCLLALLWWPPNVSSNILCDGECNNTDTELEICKPLMPLQDPSGVVPLPVMAFFPCNTDGFRARGLTVAAQMALRAVLRNTSILPGYRLELSFNNTMVNLDSAHSMTQFFERSSYNLASQTQPGEAGKSSPCRK